jgi:hypothetical protein
VQPAQQVDAPGTTTPKAALSAADTTPGCNAELRCSTTTTLSIFMAISPPDPVFRDMNSVGGSHQHETDRAGFGGTTRLLRLVEVDQVKRGKQ